MDADVKKTNRVYTWGFGKTGSLGTGKESSEILPTYIKFKENIIAVSSGLHTIMCLTEDGNVYSSGCNKQGRIGLGNTGEVFVPTLIGLNNTKISFISCGKNHCLAISINKTALGTGYNKHGELGLGDYVDRFVFTPITCLNGIKTVSAGSISLFINEDNKIYSCGKGSLNGFAAAKDVNEPHLLPEFENESIVSMHSGYTHSACVNSQGQLYTWGEGFDYQLGNGNKNRQQVPKQVKIENKIIQVNCSVGEKHCHSACIDEEGKVFTWGTGYKGKLGHGDIEDVLLPKKIESLSGIKVIKCFSGGIHTAVLTDKGKCLTFGCGSDGRLGHKESENYNVLYKEDKPREIDFFSDKKVLDISCSYYHMIGLADS